MSESTGWTDYRERLQVGSHVYFVEGKEVDGGGELIVKKAVVKHVAENGRLFRFPSLGLLDSKAGFNPSGLLVTKAAAQLFTPEDIRQFIQPDADQLTPDELEAHVDTLVADETLNTVLTSLIGGAALSRQCENFLADQSHPAN